MIDTLFFSPLKDLGTDRLEACRRHSRAVLDGAVADRPGFVMQKTFVAEDGERLSVIGEDVRERVWQRSVEEAKR